MTQATLFKSWCFGPYLASTKPSTVTRPKVFRDDIREPVKVERLQYGDLPKAEKSYRDAFDEAQDMLFIYLRDTPDAKHRRLNDAIFSWLGALSLHMMIDMIALTVNHGDAILLANYAPNSEEGKRAQSKNKLYRKIGGFMNRWRSKLLDSPEQRKRQKEFVKKIEALQEEVIGDKGDEMIYVALLATAPACQGKGYASAMMETLFARADAEGRDIYLHASAVGVPFYKFHGFEIAGKILLGTDNPSWHGPPVESPLMIRKPKQLQEKS